MARGRWQLKLPPSRALWSVPGIAQRGNRTLGNPFESLGLEWCHICKGEEDTDTTASHRAGVYVFKRWCRRCGTVLKAGSYGAPLLCDRALPAMAMEWATRPEQDRR